MTILTNNVLKSGRNDGSIREDLSNKISNISRQDTPFLSSIGAEKATQTVFDWLIDTDLAPKANAQVPGVSFTTVAPSTGTASTNAQHGRTRLFDATQNFVSGVDVADSSILSNTAGVSNEYKYQMMKRFRELKKDVEFAYTGTGTRIVYNGSVAAKTAGAFMYTGNVVDAAAGTITDAVSNSETDASNHIASTNATATASLTKTHINDLLTDIYNAGQGNPTLAMMAPALKVAISAIYTKDGTTSGEIRRLESAEKSINTAITTVMTDFGFVLGLVPNWILGSHTVSGTTTEVANANASKILFYAPANFKDVVLEGYNEKPLGQVGDNTIGLVRTKRGLKCLNPVAVGVILAAKA